MKSKTLVNIALCFIVFMFIAKVGTNIITIIQQQENEEHLVAASDDWWKKAGEWFTPKTDERGIFEMPTDAAGVIAVFSNMVNVIGTVVIVLVTIILGIKYMIGSYEAKADVKESLITLLVVCVFFFGWQGIWNLLTANQTDFIFASRTDTSWSNVVARLYTTAVYVLQFLAILAIIYTGIRYIFAGASGKADLKAKSGVFLIGAILAFASISFLSFISKVINSVV